MQWNKSKSLSQGYTLVTSRLFLLTMHPDANAECKVWTHEFLVSTEQPYQLSNNLSIDIHFEKRS